MDENRIITIEELEIGDEIIVPSNGHLRYYRILRRPMQNPKNPSRWKGVKCSENVTIEKKIRNAGSKWQREYIDTTHHCTPEGHNSQPLVYLWWKDMWLVRRNNN
jgi:hypothetical protein